MRLLAAALLLLGAALPAFGQQISTADEEMVKIRSSASTTLE
jgi:hypothetical protein